jgi:hypothetical protein
MSRLKPFMKNIRVFFASLFRCSRFSRAGTATFEAQLAPHTAGRKLATFFSTRHLHTFRRLQSQTWATVIPHNDFSYDHRFLTGKWHFRAGLNTAPRFSGHRIA